MMDSRLVVRFEQFRGTLATWDELFAQAAEFATCVGAEQLICVSHSADKSNGVVTVWYWGEPDEPAGPGTPPEPGSGSY